jgi:hypothetical protein
VLSFERPLIKVATVSVMIYIFVAILAAVLVCFFVAISNFYHLLNLEKDRQLQLLSCFSTDLGSAKGSPDISILTNF